MIEVVEALSSVRERRLLAVAPLGEGLEVIVATACALGISSVLGCPDARAAAAQVASGIGVIVVDTCLPEDGALLVANAAFAAAPEPVVIAVDGGAPRQILFSLVEIGVERFLERGFSVEQLRGCLDRVGKRSLIRCAARAEVGRTSLRSAQQELRETMLREALVASNGSRRRAAKLLGVTRPAVQRMLRESESPPARAAVVGSRSPRRS
jgi:DNA-binding NtrC family response regulator